MKLCWWLPLLLCALCWSQGFNAYQQTTFTSVTTGSPLIENTVIGFHQLSWTVSGTVATCTVALDSSPDGSAWTAGGVITGQTCTSNGNSSVTAGTANYVRVNMTAISGAGATVVVTYKGWVTSPSGGGGGTTNNASQFSLPYYSAVGSSNILGGVAGPTTPNGVPFFWVTTPAAGVATAPTPQMAGVSINTQTGTSYTIASTDRASEITQSNGSASAYTLPQAGTAGFTSNFVFALTNIGAGLLTLTPTVSTVNGGASQIVPQNWHAFGYSAPAGNGAYRMPVLPTIQAFPSCADSGGNHLNFTSATGAFSCGTSSSSTGSVPFITGTVFCTIGTWSGTVFGPITGSGGSNCGDAGAARASAIPGSYTAKNMYVSVFNGSDAATNICGSCTLVVTLVLNGSDQALTCTVGNSSSSCNDTTHTVAVTAGQVLLWRIVASGVFAGSEQDLSISAQLQ